MKPDSLGSAQLGRFGDLTEAISVRIEYASVEAMLSRPEMVLLGRFDGVRDRLMPSEAIVVSALIASLALIFEYPCSRSVNTIGSSSNRAPTFFKCQSISS